MDISLHLKDIDPLGDFPKMQAIVDCLFPFVYPIFETTRMFQFYLTALISLERCFAITKPLKFATMNRESLATKAVITSIGFAIVFNIPYWVRFYPVLYWNEDLNMNLIGPVRVYGRVKWFSDFANFPSLIFSGALPMITLCLCNIVLIVTRCRMPSRKGRSQSRQGRGQLSLLIVTITCISIATILSLHLYKVVKLTPSQNIDRSCAAKLMCTINSSTNFLFYCMFGREFRRSLVAIFKREPRVQEPRLTTSNATPSQV